MLALEQEWFNSKKHSKDYAGKWVAVFGRKIIASAKNIPALMKEAETVTAKQEQKKFLIARVPKSNKPSLSGLHF